MSTTIIYNGVTLRDCETQSFEQSVQFDESGTDVIGSKFTIRVASTLVAIHSAPQFGIDTPAGLSAVERMVDINSRLYEPRKDFWLLVDGGVTNEVGPAGSGVDGSLLVATGIPDGAMAAHPLSAQITSTVARSSVIDVDNGPKPRAVRVEKIIGGRSIRVIFEIEVTRRLCLGNYDLPPVGFGPVAGDNRVLSNRWSLDESKDENWITTRTISGTLRVVNHAHWPHLMRFLVIPPLLAGYKRVRQKFTDDPTGLVLKYQIEDRQAHAAPPWPAVSWSAHHAETATGNGLILSGEISVRLTGPPGVDKTQLIASAGKVATDRINGLVPVWVGGKKQTQKTILKSASVVNVLNEPSIELRIQAQYTDDLVTARALALRLERMGQPLTTLTGTSEYEIENYDPRVWPVPLPFDSPGPAGTFACYLQSPCSIWHGFPQGVLPGYISPPTRPEVKPANYPDQSEIENVPDPLPADETYLRPKYENNPRDNIYDFPYQFVELVQRHETKTGWAQMPLADTQGNKSLLAKLHGRVSRRVFTVTSTRDGRMPAVPLLIEEAIDQNMSREVLESFSYTIKSPELLADGSGRRFSVVSEYVYLLETGVSNFAKLKGAVSQIDRLTPQDNWLDLSSEQVQGLQ